MKNQGIVPKLVGRSQATQLKWINGSRAFLIKKTPSNRIRTSDLRMSAYNHSTTVLRSTNWAIEGSLSWLTIWQFIKSCIIFFECHNLNANLYAQRIWMILTTIYRTPWMDSWTTMRHQTAIILSRRLIQSYILIVEACWIKKMN